MKSFNKISKIIILTAVSALFLASCEEDYGSRKESTPVIESASISPTTFTFGEAVTLSAKVSDPATTLSMLEYQVISQFASGGKVIASGSIPLSEAGEVSESIVIPLASEQPDNAPVTVALTARNVLKGAAGSNITITGQRPAYSRLYLVTEDGIVAELTPQTANRDRYEASNLTLDLGVSYNYKIAEKIISGKEIDYSGAVWGNVNGRLAIIDDTGEPSFVYLPDADYTQSFVFDNFSFTVAATGNTLGDTDLMLTQFNERTFDGEGFRTVDRGLVKDREYTLFGKLADEEIVYNLDFFERTAANKVKFLGETGDYTLYYNTHRQHVVLGVEAPAYPDYLLITGGGIGYPTKVLTGDSRAHCWWGFGNPRNFILMRKISDDVFQATIFIHDDAGWVGLKPYINTGWGGDSATENQLQAYTVTGEQIFQGDNNWTPNENVDTDAVYRLTIDWVNKTVHVEKITL